MLKYDEVSLDHLVMLKSKKTKMEKMDGKKVTIVFPKGKYKINGINSVGNKVTGLTLNPSNHPHLSYASDFFDFKVKPEDVTVIPKEVKGKELD